MDIGMDLLIASYSIGKSRCDCRNHLLTLQPTSALNKRCTCFKIQPPLKRLWQFKNQAVQLQAFYCKTMKYESYCNLYLSAASSYNAQFAPKGRSHCTTAKAPRRNVYTHDLADYRYDDINTIYNLDSDVINLQASA